MSNDAPLVSIIVRTKDEERWIGSCLRAIRRQRYPRIEVVLVDNRSSDRTVAKAGDLVDRVVTIDEFLPGQAINDGIQASSGEFLVCLSGHCIPRDEMWLEHLVHDLADEEVAGVYGRQEPLSYSSPLDKRDLLITFGLDRRVQRRDSFFHNANSAFRRDVWQRFPFDECVTNIEDRLWAKAVLDAGYVLVYEPEASVYHHHGIHHGGNAQRAEQVVQIMEEMESSSRHFGREELEGLNVVALVPSRGAPLRLGDRHLLSLTVDAARESSLLDRVVVATDDDETAHLASSAGAEVVRRPADLSEEYVGVGEVLQFALRELEATGPPPDLVVVLEETHPFRPAGLVDSMIQQAVDDGVDTVIAVRSESRRLWVRQDGRTEMVGPSGLLPRSLRDSQTFLGLFGLCTVTHPWFVREGSVLGPRVGLHEVDGPLAAVEVRTAAAAAAASPVLEAWQETRR